MGEIVEAACFFNVLSKEAAAVSLKVVTKRWNAECGIFSAKLKVHC